MMFDEQPDGDPHGECAAEIHKLSSDLTKAKSLLVRLWNAHPATRPMIEGATGSWFVWGVDRDAAPATQEDDHAPSDYPESYDPRFSI